MECIVLAGGLGTRLQSVIGAYPKCMAEVDGKPFLHYLFDYIEQQGCTRVILSLGFKHEVILEWLQQQHRKIEVDYVVETEPLGTGGGISLALAKAKEQDVLVLNGDTMFRVALPRMMQYHIEKNAGTTLALKQMYDFDRYGVVQMDKNGTITAFEEKKHYDKGLINGGVYIVNKATLLSKHLPEKYSFEKDYFEKNVSDGMLFGYLSDAYFIDIGIPADYEQAKKDFKKDLE